MILIVTKKAASVWIVHVFMKDFERRKSKVVTATSTQNQSNINVKKFIIILILNI